MNAIYFHLPVNINYNIVTFSSIPWIISGISDFFFLISHLVFVFLGGVFLLLSVTLL